MSWGSDSDLLPSLNVWPAYDRMQGRKMIPLYPNTLDHVTLPPAARLHTNKVALETPALDEEIRSSQCEAPAQGTAVPIHPGGLVKGFAFQSRQTYFSNPSLAITWDTKPTSQGHRVQMWNSP